jgi:hypothetical protein
LYVDKNDLSDDELCAKLRADNPALCNATHEKLLKRDKVYKKRELDEKVVNVVIEIDTATHDEIMLRRKIRLGWRIYQCVDCIYVRRCFKCIAFGHIASDCRSVIACANCDGNHKSTECNSNVKKCCNCSTMNEKHNLTLDTKHSAWSNVCPVYLKRLEAAKKALSRVTGSSATLIDHVLSNNDIHTEILIGMYHIVLSVKRMS